MRRTTKIAVLAGTVLAATVAAPGLAQEPPSPITFEPRATSSRVAIVFEAPEPGVRLKRFDVKMPRGTKLSQRGFKACRLPVSSTKRCPGASIVGRTVEDRPSISGRVTFAEEAFSGLEANLASGPKGRLLMQLTESFDTPPVANVPVRVRRSASGLVLRFSFPPALQELSLRRFNVALDTGVRRTDFFTPGKCVDGTRALSLTAVLTDGTVVRQDAAPDC